MTKILGNSSMWGGGGVVCFQCFGKSWAPCAALNLFYKVNIEADSKHFPSFLRLSITRTPTCCFPESAGLASSDFSSSYECHILSSLSDGFVKHFHALFYIFFRRNAKQYFPWHVARNIHTSSHPTSQPRRLTSRYPDSQSSEQPSRQQSRHPDSHPTGQKSTRKPTNHSGCIPTVQEVSSPRRIYSKISRYRNVIQEL